MYVNRAIGEKIRKEIEKKDAKIVVLYGARQVGKTTLVEKIIRESKKRVLRINGDRLRKDTELSSRNLRKIETLVSGYEILFIDEAQRIPEIGINLKIIYDNIKELKVVVTGSSSLDLASSVKEAITGRKKQFKLYPVSLMELKEIYNKEELVDIIEESMIYGGYPELLKIKNKKEKVEYITEVAEDYLYKDVLELENIRYHYKLRDLLRLLSFQVGSEVSMSELGNNLGLRKETVERYIDLLEKSFVIFRLRGFSRNLRKEVNKKPKIYFYDLGVRNAVIDNFNEIDKRDDIGKLWENYVILERFKRNEYKSHKCSSYYWRTYTGAELDYIEEYGGELYGYEVKWNKHKKVPQSWQETYDARYQSIARDNVVEFIT